MTGGGSLHPLEREGYVHMTELRICEGAILILEKNHMHLAFQIEKQVERKLILMPFMVLAYAP